MITTTKNKPMTLQRIKTFLAKWPDDKPKPAAVRMLAYMVELFESNTEERVDVLLRAMHEDEKTYQQRELELHRLANCEIERFQQGAVVEGGASNDTVPHPRRERQQARTLFG